MNIVEVCGSATECKTQFYINLRLQLCFINHFLFNPPAGMSSGHKSDIILIQFHRNFRGKKTLFFLLFKFLICQPRFFNTLEQIKMYALKKQKNVICTVTLKSNNIPFFHKK